MHKKLLSIIILMCCVFLWGCMEKSSPVVDQEATQEAAGTFHRFADNDFKPINTEGFVKKVDNFTIVFDPSASMTEVYEPSYNCVACHIDYQDPDFTQSHAVVHGGEGFSGKSKQPFAMECSKCHQNPHYTKFKFAQELSQALNRTIPDFDLIGTIRTFGSPAYSSFSYGLKENDNTQYLKYDRKEYGQALEKIWEAEGVSPLAPTLREVGKDWSDFEGRIAVIVISDGKDMDKREIFAARDLKDKYGDRICIYTILLGNDPDGRVIMEQVAQSGECGLSVNGDHLLEVENMESFIREVFLARAPVRAGDDGDGDGIADCMDDCPATMQGNIVGDNGCWNLVLTADVLFDFDKDNLKPEGMIAMGMVLKMLNQYPFLDVHIGGHTDNYGSMEYNIGLSKRRAQTGKDFLVKKGIASDRITLSWHSFTIPVATNSTDEGRSLNRRLEFKFTKRNN